MKGFLRILLISVMIAGMIVSTPAHILAKTKKYVAVCSIGRKSLTYKNTKVNPISDNSVPTGKEKRIQFAKNVKFYQFCLIDDQLGYKKISRKKFTKLMRNKIESHICTIIIKNGVCVRINQEYQA